MQRRVSLHLETPCSGLLCHWDFSLLGGWRRHLSELCLRRTTSLTTSQSQAWRICITHICFSSECLQSIHQKALTKPRQNWGFGTAHLVLSFAMLSAAHWAPSSVIYIIKRGLPLMPQLHKHTVRASCCQCTLLEGIRLLRPQPPHELEAQSLLLN